MIIISFIAPYFPSRSANYHVPRSLNDYSHTVISLIIFSIALCTLIALITRLKYLRISYDLRKDYQKEAVFQIKRIINLGTLKILIFNNHHRLTVKATSDKFYKLKTGQLIEIIKSASNKILQYNIVG